MVMKKSQAQLKRLQKRAEARGEVYIASEEDDQTQEEAKSQPQEQHLHDKNDDETTTKKKKENADDDDNKRKIEAAELLQKELKEIEANEQLKAKERRSAKRKAEAIAVESSGLSSANELLEWYQATSRTSPKNNESRASKTTAGAASSSSPKNPYILFIGQLSFDTTKDQLVAYVQKHLKSEQLKANSITVRLLTDKKTGKSRGMAFLQVDNDNPKILYSILKLHLTHFNGRRINVERTTGGGKLTKKAKLDELQKVQVNYIQTSVDSILREYYTRGEIRENELDQGVKDLLCRHSCAVVERALEHYVTMNGRDMDNPSAYLSFCVGTIAEQGLDAFARK